MADASVKKSFFSRKIQRCENEEAIDLTHPEKASPVLSGRHAAQLTFDLSIFNVLTLYKPEGPWLSRL